MRICDRCDDGPCAQVPIIAQIKTRKLEVLEREPLATHYSNEFLAGLMTNPELVRNVAVVGHLHHGKTIVRGPALPARRGGSCAGCVPASQACDWADDRVE